MFISLSRKLAKFWCKSCGDHFTAARATCPHCKSDWTQQHAEAIGAKVWTAHWSAPEPPKKESETLVKFDGGQFVRIWTEDDNILKAAKELGYLCQIGSLPYTLLVDPRYDVKSVVAYLEALAKNPCPVPQKKKANCVRVVADWFLEITTSNPRVVEEAKKFGRVHNIFGGDQWDFFLDKRYDADEVIAYLESLS